MILAFLTRCRWTAMMVAEQLAGTNPDLILAGRLHAGSLPVRAIDSSAARNNILASAC